MSPLLATGIGPLPEAAADIIQQSIENGYTRFLEVVGSGRDLDPSYVDSIGQGRVWIGSKAQEIKLVDNLGSFDDAVAAAAKLAELEDYDQVEMIETFNPFEKFLSTSSARVLKFAGFSEKDARSSHTTLRRLITKASDQLAFFDEFNDPNAAYARCLSCEAN